MAEQAYTPLTYAIQSVFIISKFLSSTQPMSLKISG